MTWRYGTHIGHAFAQVPPPRGLSPEERRAARLVCANNATDVEELRRFLDALDLHPDERDR